MKYVFFGTPRFAAIVLEGLLRAGTPPAALVCNPDRPVGRKKIITPPPTKQLVRPGDPIEVLQPEALDAAFIEKLQALSPDLFIVAAYAKILPQAVLALPRLGTIGVHPSLLPRYRGASPIQSAILDDALETGVTLYLMDEKMDHGPILARRPMPLDALVTDYPALEAQLATLGAAMLAETMPALAEGRTASRVQDETDATFTKKFSTDDACVDEKDLACAEKGGDREATKIAKRILRTINAFTPEPGAWTVRDGKRIKLLKAEINDGRLVLRTVQNEGERPRAL